MDYVGKRDKAVSVWLALLMLICQFGCSSGLNTPIDASGGISSAGNAADDSIIFDKEDVVITFLNIEPIVVVGEVQHTEFIFKIENNRQDVIRVYASDLSVNGAMFFGFWIFEVIEPGETLEASVSAPHQWLHENNIDLICDVEFRVTIEVVDSIFVQLNQRGEIIYVSDLIKISFSDASDYKQIFNKNGIYLCNDSGLLIVLQDVELTDTGFLLCRVFIENENEYDCFIKLSLCSVDGEALTDFAFNGTVVYGANEEGIYISDELLVCASKVAYSSFYFDINHLGQGGTKDSISIDISFEVYNESRNDILFTFSDIVITYAASEK